MRRLTRGLRKGSGLLLIVMIFIWGADRLRAPTLPEDLAAVPVTGMNDANLNLAELSQSQPLLVYVWASWCNICKLTTRSVANLIAEGKPVLSVAIRSGDDAQVETWMRKKSLNGPGINDQRGELAQRWDIAATPTFIVLYKGKVVSTTSGWTSGWGLTLRLWWAKHST
ncbi:protein disulfide oxidoreductase [Pantoea sp. LMR881]|uniref:protein disulfide oxidoreductase n=1 Tax=Pantoea sp. LMR881 TaxID=3014336 RepID=UPI0022AEBAD8|nr:protein disulfide oxidoreductase [Pantoea sp. LMR881]MCZ4058370.1 protein disulfide oxidoreductase [Pantoea sp. LMR881]